MHVVHISSVHPAGDPRIRLKELAAVTAAGWDATLITGDLRTAISDEVATVRIRPGNDRRVLRMLLTAPRAVLRALRTDADIYHFHDPELIPWAWLLLLKRVPVVYDIHEDYVTAIRQKRYLPRWARRAAAGAMAVVERLATAPFTRVIAERYYRRRFPEAVPILNYPSRTLLELPSAFDRAAYRALYTGSISMDRGALNLARVVRDDPDLGVTVVGRCPVELAEAMEEEAGAGQDRLEVVGRGAYVPFDEIAARYREGGWLAGLALFPDTEHYREKELTKFFEYMAVGLPIVASDFPVWRALIEDRGVGRCIDPGDPSAAVEALRWLRTHPAEAAAMSERGRELVRDIYNWEREGRRLTDVYRHLAGG